MPFIKRTIVGVATLSVLIVVQRPASANLFSDVLGIFTNGGDFWDFGAIFNSQGWDNPLGDIINQSVGTNGQDIVGNDKSVFDIVYGTVGSELGFPAETIEAISSGDLSSILDVVMSDVLGNIGLENIDLGTVLGRSGIPAPERIDEILKQDTRNLYQSVYGQYPTIPPQNGDSTSSATVNVNPSLINRIQAGAVLTDAITAIGLSPEGQEISAARRAGAETALESSQQMGGQSTALAEAQLEVSEGVADDVEAQTSTQDVLKAALTGSLMLNAQSLQMGAYNAEQGALALQVDSMDLTTSIESRDGIYTVGRGIQTINEQAVRDYQQDLARESSGRIVMNKGIRMMGVAR